MSSNKVLYHDFNATNLADPTWNLGNCTANTDYWDVVWGECICKFGYSGRRCQYYEPGLFYIRVVVTQIIMGICLALAACLGAAIFVRSLLQPSRRKKWLRIVASGLSSLGFLLKIVFLIDLWEKNRHIRSLPRLVGTVFTSLGTMCEIFAVVLVLAYWLELLHTRLAIFKTRIAAKVAIASAIVWFIIVLVLQIIYVVGVEWAQIASTVFAAICLITFPICTVITALLLRKRLKLLPSSKLEQSRATSEYVLRVSKFFLLVPIPCVSYMLLVLLTYLYGHTFGDKPFQTVRKYFDAIQMLCEIGYVVPFLVSLNRRPIWVEVVRAIRNKCATSATRQYRIMSSATASQQHSAEHSF